MNIRTVVDYIRKYGIKRTFGKVAAKIGGRCSGTTESGLYHEIYEKVNEFDGAGFRLAVSATGGMGDYIVLINYLHHLRELIAIDTMRIDLFFPNGIKTAKYIIKEDKCFHLHEGFVKEQRKYDLVLEVSRFPLVLYANREKILRYCPWIMEYIGVLKKFEWEHEEFVKRIPYYDGISATYCIENHQIRLQQPDVDRYLNIGVEYRYPIRIDLDENEFLERVHLKNRRFLTIHHGCDSDYDTNVKLWDVDNYRILVKKLKKEHPEIVIVQMGISKERFPEIEDVDVQLVGRTTLEEVKTLLKYSSLHIDNEGGMVHLRHALGGGKSVVAFGPTSKAFFGYPENSNVSSEVCQDGCEWVVDGWTEQCVRSNGKAECMKQLSVEQIYQEAHKCLMEM